MSFLGRMDDYSQFILAHKLQQDMTADSLIEVIREAVDRTGMTDVPVADWNSALSQKYANINERCWPGFHMQSLSRRRALDAC